MSGRKLFTKEENKLIKKFIVEHNMLFGVWDTWNAVANSQIDYLDSNTIGKATCPLCGRLYIGTDDEGFGWCIKCDWRK